MNFDESSRLYPERGPGKTFPVTTPLEKALLVIVAIVVVIGIGLTIAIVGLKKTNNDYLKKLEKGNASETGICFTPSCISEANNLLKSLDMNVDPCTDFYAFACGNWIKNNHAVTGLESQFTKLTRNIVLRTKDILEDIKNEKNLPVNKAKMVAFYKSCMDKVHRNNMGAKELLSDLKKFGGWPLIDKEWEATKFDWTNLMIELFQNGYISHTLFAIKVEVDIKNTSRSLLSVTPPTLGLGKTEYYTLPLAHTLNSYKNVIFKLAKHLNGNISEEESKEDVEKAFQLENNLAQLKKEIDMKLPNTYYHIYSLKELEKLAPKIPWKKILENLLPPHTKIEDDDRVMVPLPSFIKGLNKILEDLDDVAGRRVLANYMFYRVVLDAANYLSREFYSLVSELPERNKGSSLPWEICTRITTELFPLPLAAVYASKYTDDKTKKLVEMMFRDLKDALMGSIKSASWLDNKTKDYALFKVKEIKVVFGYPDEVTHDENLDSYYKDVNITDDHFGNIKQLIAFNYKLSMEELHEQRTRFKWTEVDNLLVANAYYRPGENSIIIPVGVLQDPIFAAERPNYINYGSLGMIVAHELTHAFDSSGSLFDAQGSFRMWWSKESWKKFEGKMKCYEDQYNSYYFKPAEAHVNGTLTLGENIADNGGLMAAYNAYSNLLSRTSVEKTLPGLPYNQKQLFWIAFATVWCRKQTNESIHHMMKTSVHTHSQFRVIGALSNTEEFFENFNCKPNSAMKRTAKCNLWK